MSFLEIYLAIGCVWAIFMFLVLFSKSFDEWMQETEGHVYPLSSKIGTVVLSPFIWPVQLYWAVTK